MNNYKYCPNCGTRNNSNADFCKRCGHKLPMIKQSKSINQQKEVNEKSRKRPSRKNMLKVYIVFVCMYIIWGIIMYIFSLLSPNILIITGIIGSLAILLSYKKGYIRHVILFLLSMFVVLGLILLAFNPMVSQHNASQKMSQFQNALPNNQWVIHVGHMNTNGKGEVDNNHSTHSISNGIIHASDDDNTGDANYHINGSNIYLSGRFYN